MMKIILISVLIILLLMIGIAEADDVSTEINYPDPHIASVWNNVSGSSTNIEMSNVGTIEFGVEANQSIDTWHWSGVDNYTNTSTTSNATKTFSSNGTYSVSVYGENNNGSTQTVTWSVEVGEEEESAITGMLVAWLIIAMMVAIPVKLGMQIAEDPHVREQIRPMMKYIVMITGLLLGLIVLTQL